MTRSNTANAKAGNQSVRLCTFNVNCSRVDSEREKSSSDIPTLTVSPVIIRKTPTPPIHLGQHKYQPFRLKRNSGNEPNKDMPRKEANQGPHSQCTEQEERQSCSLN